MDGSSPSSSVHGIFQAKILEWVAISFSNAGIKPPSPAMAGGFFTTESPEKPTVEYYSAIKKNEIMPFAATWMSQEIVILSEVSQREKEKYHDILYM